MSAHVAPEVYTIGIGEIRNVAVSFVDTLDVGELLTGTPTVVEVGTSALTLSSKVVNTVTLTINGETVLAGQAVTFNVNAASAVAGTVYYVLITCSTNATPAQTIKVNVRMVGAVA